MYNTNSIIRVMKNNINGRQILIWGAWKYGKQLADQLKNIDIDVHGYIDSQKYGTTFCSLPVYETSIIDPIKYYIFVSLVEHADVFRTLNNSGYTENTDFVYPDKQIGWHIVKIYMRILLVIKYMALSLCKRKTAIFIYLVPPLWKLVSTLKSKDNKKCPE